MEHFFFAFWWLIFPIMGFAMGGYGMWIKYRMQRDRMELMRSLIAQGKSPEEVAKAFGPGSPMGDPWGMNHAGWGAGWGHGWGGPGYQGPLHEWRRTVIFGALAAGFGIAAWYAAPPGAEYAFTIVALIMGVMAAASLIFAIIATAMASKMRDEK